MVSRPWPPDNISLSLSSSFRSIFLEEKCAEKGWEILELAIQPDHVHLLVRVWPADSAADVFKECKGASSFRLREKYPSELKRLPSLWTRSYFASTAENVSQETIKRYIEAQKGI
jgi:putative transposase